MRTITSLIIILFVSWNASAQYQVQLGKKASIGVNPNIETYFFVEKLAVEHIDNFVFDIKGIDYSHQPMVHYAFKHFQRYQNDPIIIRTAEILKQIRDAYHDNGPIMDYLLNQQAFPAKGSRFPGKENDKSHELLPELTDSLRKFYIKADVAGFLKKNSHFYKGALNEVAKDINKSSFEAMEKWYGQQYPQYELYISPAMPITPGDDSYRGYGPIIFSPHGKIPSMVISSSKMLKVQEGLPLYKEYGFDNREVTSFIANHEISHSFVNPQLEKYAQQIKGDSILFVKALKDKLAPYGTQDWYTCVTEHLVRLGEIRIALSMGNKKEADRLWALHTSENNYVLIPLLEEKIVAYEADRVKYPTYESYLPELVEFLHSLTPQIINEQLSKFETR